MERWKDYLIKLNQVGRKQAHEAGDIKSDISQSVAFGGPRERSAETAMRTMVGPDSDFGGENHSFSDLLKISIKIGVWEVKLVLMKD